MPLDLKSLRELHARTTPGTWRYKALAGELWCGPNILADIAEHSDAAFIVAAHEHWVALLDALEQAEKDETEWVRVGNRYEAELESLRAEVARLKEKANLTGETPEERSAREFYESR